jgi:CheY-like chemotaxis protein
MGVNATGSVIQDMRVFVVEDELLLVLMLEDMLADLGCILAGSAGTVAEALSQIVGDSAIDAAILDVHLGGEVVYPVADALRERSVPFIFSTGFGSADLAARYPNYPLLAKPYPPDALAAALAGVRVR